MEGKDAMDVNLNALLEPIPRMLTNTRERGILETDIGSRKKSTVRLDWIVHV